MFINSADLQVSDFAVTVDATNQIIIGYRSNADKLFPPGDVLCLMISFQASHNLETAKITGSGPTDTARFNPLQPPFAAISIVDFAGAGEPGCRCRCDLDGGAGLPDGGGGLADGGGGLADGGGGLADGGGGLADGGGGLADGGGGRPDGGVPACRCGFAAPDGGVRGCGHTG